MFNHILQVDEILRREADDFLWSNKLYALLSEYGIPKLHGSYALKLMTWRDLDIYLIHEKMAMSTFFALGGHLAELLCPHRMSFRNEYLAQSKGLPKGFYWGIHLGNERQNSWKIDLWAIEQQEYQQLAAMSDVIASRLSEASRIRILEIKYHCWRDPHYRKEYTSVDIYHAVLDEHVESVVQFNDWLIKNKGFGITSTVVY